MFSLCSPPYINVKGVALLILVFLREFNKYLDYAKPATISRMAEPIRYKSERIEVDNLSFIGP